MMRRKVKNAPKPFTLLEIVISMAILALIASVSGFGIKSMVADYQCRKGQSMLLSDLKKCQLIALANQTDLELSLWKEGEKCYYQFKSDDPIAFFPKARYSLPGVVKICEGKKETKALHIPLYSTGRIGNQPLTISFFKKNGEGYILDLYRFKIEPRSAHAHNQS